MMRLMSGLMPSCREVSELVSLSMDKQPPLRRRIAARMHLWMCALCRRYEKQLHLIRKGTQLYASPEANAGDALSPEARARLQRKLSAKH